MKLFQEIKLIYQRVFVFMKDFFYDKYDWHWPIQKKKTERLIDFLTVFLTTVQSLQCTDGDGPPYTIFYISQN